MHLHPLRAQQAEVLQIAIHLVVIHAPPDGEPIRQRKPHDVQAGDRLRRRVLLGPQPLLEEAHHAQGLGLALGLDERDEFAERRAGVDDVLDEDDVLGLEGREVRALDFYLLR